MPTITASTMHLDAGRDDIAEHAFGGERLSCRTALRGSGLKPCERRQLEFNQGDKELDSQNEEGEQHITQANSNTTIWTKFSKKLT
jgi:hypothetical protein